MIGQARWHLEFLDVHLIHAYNRFCRAPGVDGMSLKEVLELRANLPAPCADMLCPFWLKERLVLLRKNRTNMKEAGLPWIMTQEERKELRNGQL